jgi:hypothetical protein
MLRLDLFLEYSTQECDLDEIGTESCRCVAADLVTSERWSSAQNASPLHTIYGMSIKKTPQYMQ